MVYAQRGMGARKTNASPGAVDDSRGTDTQGHRSKGTTPVVPSSSCYRLGLTSSQTGAANGFKVTGQDGDRAYARR